VNSARLATSARYSNTSSRGLAMVVETVTGFTASGLYVRQGRRPRPRYAAVWLRIRIERLVDGLPTRRLRRGGLASREQQSAHRTWPASAR
jgi:hypothetical protein